MQKVLGIWLPGSRQGSVLLRRDRNVPGRVDVTLPAVDVSGEWVGSDLLDRITAIRRIPFVEGLREVGQPVERPTGRHHIELPAQFGICVAGDGDHTAVVARVVGVADSGLRKTRRRRRGEADDPVGDILLILIVRWRGVSHTWLRIGDDIVVGLTTLDDEQRPGLTGVQGNGLLVICDRSVIRVIVGLELLTPGAFNLPVSGFVSLVRP